MQIDFHHAVTYIVARLAGFGHTDSCIIAYAAQYVDNATNRGTIRFDNGTTYDHIASAHEVFDVNHNSKNDEDYQVWVPFHFLPGNNGALSEKHPVVPLIQRLVCTPDSPLANDMWLACRNVKGSPNSLHRLGITAHVYADTFAHQMFAGIRHDVNLVFLIKHLEPECRDMLEKFKSMAADALKLGHGAALTNPDLPFLNWTYQNSFGQERARDNPAIFLESTMRLFSQFSYFLGATSEMKVQPQDRDVLVDTIHRNVSTDANLRHERWIALLKDGAFSFGALCDREVAELGYAAKGPGSWKHAALKTIKAQDSPDEEFPYDPDFENSNWRRFHDALKDHQREVLEVILPRYALPSSFEAKMLD